MGGESRTLGELVNRLNMDPVQRREFAEAQHKRTKKKTSKIIKQRAQEQKIEAARVKEREKAKEDKKRKRA